MSKDETLEENFEIFNELIKKCEMVEIISEMDGKRQCHQQLKAIAEYKPGSAVNTQVINTIAISTELP